MGGPDTDSPGGRAESVGNAAQHQALCEDHSCTTNMGWGPPTVMLIENPFVAKIHEHDAPPRGNKPQEVRTGRKKLHAITGDDTHSRLGIGGSCTALLEERTGGGQLPAAPG